MYVSLKMAKRVMQSYALLTVWIFCNTVLIIDKIALFRQDLQSAEYIEYITV